MNEWSNGWINQSINQWMNQSSHQQTSVHLINIDQSHQQYDYSIIQSIMSQSIIINHHCLIVNW